MEKQTDWVIRFLRLAQHVAMWSKDPSTQCGAVIVDHHRRVVGMGFNGFPRGIRDDPSRLNDRPEKYGTIVHAELNAILNATRSVEGCSMYVWPMLSCNECAKAIIQSGINLIVAPLGIGEDTNTRWGSQLEFARRMFAEANVIVCETHMDETHVVEVQSVSDISSGGGDHGRPFFDPYDDGSDQPPLPGSDDS